MDQAQNLADALGISVHDACAALQRHGGDADAVCAEAFAQAATPSLSTQPTPANPPMEDQDLGHLMDMGFSREKAEHALGLASGNLEEALDYLMQEVSSSPAPQVLPAGTPSTTQPATAGHSSDDMRNECAICCEPVGLSDAAMRCDGHGGSHHYGHAACLAQWAQRCRADGTTPNCPTCRGTLQLHRHHLRDFLQESRSQQSSAGRNSGSQLPNSMRRRQLSQEDSEVLQSMLQNTSNSSCEEWSDIDFGKVAGFALAAGAVVVAGLLVKGLFDHARDKRSRR